MAVLFIALYKIGLIAPVSLKEYQNSMKYFSLNYFKLLLCCTHF